MSEGLALKKRLSRRLAVRHPAALCCIKSSFEFYVMEPSGAVFTTFAAHSENNVCGSFGEYGGNISRSSFIVASPTAFLELEWLNPVRVRHGWKRICTFAGWARGDEDWDPPEGKLPPWEYQLCSLPGRDDTCPLDASGISGPGNPMDMIKKANPWFNIFGMSGNPMAMIRKAYSKFVL